MLHVNIDDLYFTSFKSAFSAQDTGIFNNSHVTGQSQKYFINPFEGVVAQIKPFNYSKIFE